MKKKIDEQQNESSEGEYYEEHYDLPVKTEEQNIPQEEAENITLVEEFCDLLIWWDEVEENLIKEHVKYDSELQDELRRENSSVADAENLDAVPVHSTCSLNYQFHI